MKNLLNSVMLFLLLFIGQNAWGQEVVASGNLVNDGSITWSVEQTGTDGYTLNITGSGEMPDYSGLKGMPWAQCKSSNGTTTDYCSKITELNIDSRITKIGRRSFLRISKITSVTIPENCVSIGQEAFRLCIGLKEIYIPSSVTSIGMDAFSNCRNLGFIHYDARCDANTGIAFSNVAASGKIIEKSGTGDSYANVPEGWEYYTHGVQCNGGAWVAENADQTKLFFYAQNPGATVNYAGRKASGTSTNDERYHPWRVNCMNYTSLEINKNIATIAASELIGYETNGLMYGYANIQNITVESGNENFVVGDEGALYNKAKTIVYLYPAKSTATEIEIPSTVTQVRPGAFLGAMNLKSITFLGTVKTIYAYVFAYARSLNKIYFASQTAPTTYYDTSFIGVPSTGVVFAGADTEAFQTLTTTIGSNWTFDGETYGPVKSYISDGTLYVVGKGEYTTSSSNADWYSQRSSIKKIVVKEGITYIGSSAFANCSNVTEATLNNNGKIGYSAFKDCSALTRVNIGGGVSNFDYCYTPLNAWHYTETVDAFPFEGCSKLTTINVTDLASYCPVSNLKYLTDSEYGTASVKTLMVKGVTHPSTSELVIPEGVDSISQAAFRYFSNVTKIKFPSSLKTIVNDNFYGHTYLTEITVPSTVSYVGGSAFYGCTSLKTATLNNNGNIYYSAFSGCTALQTVTLNNNGKIGSSAFKDCSALTRVNIGGGVSDFDYSCYQNKPGYGWTDVDAFPFEGCSKLATINVTDLASYCPVSNLKYLTDSEYGTASVKTLMVKGVTHPSTSELVIPEGVDSISQAAFRYFSNVTKIKFPSSLKTIVNDNFYGHTYLTEITVPSTVSYVGGSAFYGCTSLKTATLNNNGNIYYSAFSGCTALQTVTLNNNGKIGSSAFKDCSALTRVNIGGGVSDFDYSCYQNKPGYGWTDVDAFPFAGCSKLATINVTDLVSFNNNLNIKYLTDGEYGTAEKKTLMINGEGVWGDEILYLPEEITSYNNSALRYFSNVQRISLPSTMTTVSGFNDHSYLTHVTLSSKVESVTKNAFANCSNLKRIVCLATTCPSTTGSIATEPSSITLKVPYGTASLYKAADVWKEFNVEGGKQYVYDINIDVLQSVKLSNLHNILTTEKALSWNSSNTAVATVSDGVVTGTNFVYDGSTLQPAKYVKITAELEDGDSYFCGVHVSPKEVALTDGSAYRLATDLEAEKISYTRSFSDKVVGKWQCFYVPFDIEITDELLKDFDFAKLYMVSYIDANDNGEIEDGEPLRMTFNKFSAGRTLHANMPYFVRVKSAGTKTIEVTNAVLKAAENGSVNCSTTEHEYTLVGIYEPTYMQGRYGMSTSGAFTYITSSTTKLGANRWYMEITSRTGKGAEMENYARPIEIYVDGEEETTGISAIDDKVSDSQNGKIYTLDGRQVTDFETLPSGIYIINGKKVFKK